MRVRQVVDPRQQRPDQVLRFGAMPPTEMPAEAHAW